MRVLYGIIVFFALFLLACSDAEREEKRLEGNLLMKGDSGVCYDGIGLTESYLVLLARGCDTIIQVFDKDDLSHLHAFALKGYGATYFSNPEFMKSNTKEPAGKDITLSTLLLLDSVLLQKLILIVLSPIRSGDIQSMVFSMIISDRIFLIVIPSVLVN